MPVMTSDEDYYSVVMDVESSCRAVTSDTELEYSLVDADDDNLQNIHDSSSTGKLHDSKSTPADDTAAVLTDNGDCSSMSDEPEARQASAVIMFDNEQYSPVSELSLKR